MSGVKIELGESCGKTFMVGASQACCVKAGGHEGECACACNFQKRDLQGFTRLCTNEARKPHPENLYGGALCDEHHALFMRERRAKAIGQAQLLRVLASQIEATEEPIKFPYELKTIFAGLVSGIYND